MDPLTGVATAVLIERSSSSTSRPLRSGARGLRGGGPAFIGTVRAHGDDVDSGGAVTGVDLT
jgi:hypothetical protein